MEQTLNLTINRLPALTWHHLGMNQTSLEQVLAEGEGTLTIETPDGVTQPAQDDLPAIEATIRNTLTALCENGLDRAQIEASLASFEFKLRERDYGTMPRGLVFELEILSSWLYGGDPAARLCFSEVFDDLRAAIGTGYYETLLRRLLLPVLTHKLLRLSVSVSY